MDADKIIQDLNRRFAAPLPEFYKRRIVVWIDEDQEFVDKLDEITINGAKIVVLTGTNNYQLYFTDSSGKPISDVQKIIADKTSDNGQDRTFRCSFNLKSLKYSNTDTYYLVIADENGLQVQREEFQIDIAFAVDEFDFFG